MYIAKLDCENQYQRTCCAFNRVLSMKTSVLFAALLLAYNGIPAEPMPTLRPGNSFTITFPDMPPTFYAMYAKKDEKAQITVFLPRNYDPGRKHPLLVFLNGGDGGTASNPGLPARFQKRRISFVLVCRFSKRSIPKPGADILCRTPTPDICGPFSRPCFPN